MPWDSGGRSHQHGWPMCRMGLESIIFQAARWDVGTRARPNPTRDGSGRLVGESGSRPISRVLSRTTIHLGRALPRASSDLPGNSRGPRVQARKPACFPIWSCSRWGLPCRRMLPPARCALTAPFHPCRHHTAAMLGRSALCCTFRGLAPPRRYLAPRPMEPGLSSAAMQRLPGRLPRRLYRCGPQSQRSIVEFLARTPGELRGELRSL